MGTFVKDGNECIGCCILEEFPDKCDGCSNLKNAVTLIKEFAPRSRPAGGSSAAGSGQRACSSDGPVDPAQSDARRLTLVPVKKIKGNGWYLRYIEDEGYMAFDFIDHKKFPKQ